MDVDTIVKFIIMVICIVFTYVIVPFIKQKLGDAKYYRLMDYISYSVRAMEQTNKTNEEKKETVTNFIISKSNELGLGLKEEEIDNLIEGIVNYIKHNGGE